MRKPKAIGVNHVALEVANIDAALAFYGAIFDFSLRGRHDGMAFIELGDQFIALSEVPGRTRGETPARHFGLVVDDRDGVRELAVAAGAELVPGPFLDFLDPWGNRIEVVDYAKVQFRKAPAVVAAMGFDGTKSEAAEAELREKGML